MEDVCRDERCAREELHCAHEVDGQEQAEDRQGHADEALIESIARAITPAVPKSSLMLYHDVENDYGSVNKRTFYRYLKRLVERGIVLRIDLGDRLYAYLHPASKMRHDLDLLHEQIRDSYA